MSAARVQTPPPDVPKWALSAAKTLASDSGRREEIPVRRLFVRNDDPEIQPPLARLVSTGGRGGAVPLKLYLALIWRCSAEPHSTDILARRWAALLGLEEPDTLGARRVTKALNLLEELRLVSLERRRGDSTVITLLHESGSGDPYSLPSTAYTRSMTDAERESNRYFKVPPALWTEGHVQSMSAPALAMLLVLLAERNRDGRRTWWSTDRFPSLFSLSPTVRSKGTAELVERRLITVNKELVTSAPSATFSRERVRHTYRLRGSARPLEMIEADAKKAAGSRRRTRKSVVLKRS